MKNFIKKIIFFIVVVFGALSFGSMAFADYSATTTLTTSGNFTVPAGVTNLNVTLVGAGGGGGGGAFTYGGGGGGAGSSISNIIIPVVSGQTISYTVGLGGTAGTTGSFSVSAGNGGNGENTVFGASTALGGFGGQGAIVGSANGLGGLAGGIGGTNGTDGASAVGERTYGGNGGTTSFGSGGNGGTGRESDFTLPIAGTNGNGGGGGSGWAYFADPINQDAGARGGDGLIIVTYYVDETSPVITAPATQIFEATGATTTPILIPATAVDNIDPNPIISYLPNSFTLGTTTVIWTATDLAGNIATTTSLVVIIDTTAPMITLNGFPVLTFLASTTQSYLDAGATAFDLVDGTTTVNINPVVDLTTQGTYLVYFDSTDSSGNIATTTRLINVTLVPDVTAPVITLIGANPLNVFASSTGVYVDPGATAIDDMDASVIPQPFFNDVNLTVDGSYSFTYIAMDSSGNTSTSTRTVIVSSSSAVLTSINILPQNMSLMVSATTTFSSITLDQYGNAFATTTIWNSSDVSVGTIDASGIFTALSVGTTTITGTAGSISASTTISVTPLIIIPDTTAPTVPTITNASATGTVTTIASISWANSTDTESGLNGYVILWNNASSTQLASTTPGIVVITGTGIANANFGTQWFHIASIDNAGNISGTIDVGPFVISDSQVLIMNSTIGGTYYDLYSPTLAQAQIASTTGTTTITNSNLINWWNVQDSSISSSTINNSTIINSNLNRCTVIDSNVLDFTGSDCYIDPTTITEPSSGVNATSTGITTIINSNFDNSIIDNSYLATSTVNFSTTTFAYISTSTISNSTLNNSTTTDSVITGSSLTNSQLVNSTSTNSNILNTIITNGEVSNGIINSGTITNASGTVIVISTPTPLTSILNYPPLASFTITMNGLVATITDTSSDLSSGTIVGDSYNYIWNFGDGTSIVNATSTLIGNNQTHIYSAAGNYIITLSLIDAFGLISNYSSTINVTVPPAPQTAIYSNGGGGVPVPVLITTPVKIITATIPTETKPVVKIQKENTVNKVSLNKGIQIPYARNDLGFQNVITGNISATTSVSSTTAEADNQLTAVALAGYSNNPNTPIIVLIFIAFISIAGLVLYYPEQLLRIVRYFKSVIKRQN